MSSVLLESGRSERLSLNKFLNRVFPEPNTGCWIGDWMPTKKGYGNTNKVITGGYTLRGSHRISYYLHKGPFDTSLCVCHTCDNPACVNPDHLFLDTSIGNTKDMVKKGRASKGEHRPNAVFSEKQVLEIRQKYATGNYTYRGLSKEYGHDVKSIILNETWRHIL